MRRTSTKLLIIGGYAFHHFEMEPMPYIALPKNPSWAELNKGKKSKRQRRK